MEITELSAYKGDTYYLELDDGRKTYLNSAVVMDFDLCKGDNISEELFEEIKSADALRKARKRALYILGTREYGYTELYKKLRRTYDEETSRTVADTMKEYGYVNDEEYAPKLAEYLIRTKRWGLYKVRYEMLLRGLDENLVEDVLSEYSEEDIDEEITELIMQKYYSKIFDFDGRRKTIAALARRGYDYGAVKRCVEAVIEEQVIGDEDAEYGIKNGCGIFGLSEKSG